MRQLSYALLRPQLPKVHTTAASTGTLTRFAQTLDLPTDSVPLVGLAASVDPEQRVPTITALTRVPHEGLKKAIVDVVGAERASGVQFEVLVTGSIVVASRPVHGGDSIGEGNSFGQSGSVGCMVEELCGTKYLLTCNHVIARLDQGIRGADAVWAPGRHHGGANSSKIGILRDYEPIRFGGLSVNCIDAAIAEPDDLNDTTPEIRHIGRVNGHRGFDLNPIVVQKTGPETDHTTGTALYEANFMCDYPGHGSALFHDQIGIFGDTEPFARQGDSGSLVVDLDNRAVGMIAFVAEDTDFSLANPIEPILARFGVELCR
ncbi:MAG: hypothetical protein RLO01_05715 [Thalassobaculaceae bacterium]